jgi:phospholipid/cholesterol/gamma-HCH transport system substrate-binding protein
LANADKSLGNFSEITNSLSEADLGKTVKELEATLKNFNSILASLEKGEGSMGKLLKDEELYNNLEGATEELEELLRDIKLHPKRYFRILSKKEIPYQNEETN